MFLTTVIDLGKGLWLKWKIVFSSISGGKKMFSFYWIWMKRNTGPPVELLAVILWWWSYPENGSHTELRDREAKLGHNFWVLGQVEPKAIPGLFICKIYHIPFLLWHLCWCHCIFATKRFTKLYTLDCTHCILWFSILTVN